jgi:hypothetical protein
MEVLERSVRGTPMDEFPYQSHIDLILRLTKECKCSLTEEDTDTNL